MDKINLEHFGSQLIFRSRPEAISGDFRPIWRICVVLLFLRLTSYGGKATLSKIHVLNWAIRTRENQDNLMKVVNGEVSPDLLIVRIEPSLNRAVELARGEGLLSYVKGDRIQLTWQGGNIVDKLLETDNLFIEEKKFLMSLGKSKLTEQVIADMFSEGK